MNQANPPDASSPVPEAAAYDPDDWALMRWLDGDLDDDEGEAFAARLEEDEELAAKGRDLDLTADVLASLVDEDERADGIADLVMAKLDDTADADADADSDLGALSPPALPTPAIPPKSGAANDNARTIFGLAAGAAAVAAGLFLWGMQGDGVETEARRPPPRKPPVAVAEGPSEVAPSAETVDDEPATSDGDEPGVEVAAVDFGSHSGSVFYVAGDQTSTAVVWITDGGDE